MGKNRGRSNSNTQKALINPRKPKDVVNIQPQVVEENEESDNDGEALTNEGASLLPKSSSTPSTSSDEGASEWTTVITLSKICIGTGILTLPSAFTSGGYLVSIILMYLVMRWNLYGVNRLLVCEEGVTIMTSEVTSPVALRRRLSSAHGNDLPNLSRNGSFADQRVSDLAGSLTIDDSFLKHPSVSFDPLTSLPRANSIVGGAPTPPPELSTESTISRIAYLCFGTSGKSLIFYAITSLMFGVCTSYQVAASTFITGDPFLLSLMSPVTSLVGISTVADIGRFTSFLSFIVLYPLCVSFGNVNLLSKFSAMGLGAIVVTFLVILIPHIFTHGVTFMNGANPLTIASLFPQSVSAVSQTFGIFSFSFGITPVIFSVKETMRAPSAFKKCATSALTLVFASYVVLGDGTALLLRPEGVDEPSLKGDVLSQLPSNYVLLSSFVRLMMCFVVCVSYPLCLIPCSEMIDRRLAEVTTNEVSNDVDSLLEKKKERRRKVIKTLLILSTTALSTLIPSFVLIVSLIGCFNVGVVSYIIPPLFHLRMLDIRYDWSSLNSGVKGFGGKEVGFMARKLRNENDGGGGIGDEEKGQAGGFQHQANGSNTLPQIISDDPENASSSLDQYITNADLYKAILLDCTMLLMGLAATGFTTALTIMSVFQQGSVPSANPM
jgi:amino acid permease